MTEPKYCTNCTWSIPEPRSEWILKCTHPKVNMKDAWALAAAVIVGKTCSEERKLLWDNFPACGKTGKLYKSKLDSSAKSYYN